MSKALILLLGLAVLSQASPVKLTQSFFSDNYSGLKEFVQGLLDGYNDRQMDLPSNCLNSDSQSKLDEDVVAMLKAILRVNVEKFIEELYIFEGDLTAVVDDCGLTEIVDNYQQDVRKNGKLWVITNFFWHFYEIQEYALECLEHILEEQWYKAGEKFGKMIDYVVPHS